VGAGESGVVAGRGESGGESFGLLGAPGNGNCSAAVGFLAAGVQGLAD
jgi:hypothetical protein